MTDPLWSAFTGKKRVREDWELIYYWGMFGGMALGGVLIFYKPDTRCVIGLSFLSCSFFKAGPGIRTG